MLARPTQARRAISALFFAHGFVAGNWVPRIPEMLLRLDLGSGAMGLLILIIGIGALVAMPVTGALAARHGSRGLSRALGIALAPTLPIVALVPDVHAAGVALFAFGVLLGGCDVAMNANAIAAERLAGRPVLSSMHGFWSLGGLVGSGLGGPLLAGLGYVPHAFLVGVVALALALAAWPGLAREEPESRSARSSFTLPRKPQIYAVGLIALLGMIPEGAILDWSALYLRQELGAEIGASGLAFALFSGAMAVNRFLGDGLRHRLGPARAMAFCVLVTASGLLLMGLGGSLTLVCAGALVAGLGIANIVPIAFAAGGSVPGLASAQGIAVVTTIGCSGILIAPSAIGFIAERTGFAAVFAALALLPLAILALVHHLTPASEAEGRPLRPQAR